VKSIASLEIMFLLPRDAMRKRGLSCCPVSVCHVRVIQTADDIVKRLSRPDSSRILVFWPWALIPIQSINQINQIMGRWELRQRARKIYGGGKILRFST